MQTRTRRALVAAVSITVTALMLSITVAPPASAGFLSDLLAMLTGAKPAATTTTTTAVGSKPPQITLLCLLFGNCATTTTKPSTTTTASTTTSTTSSTTSTTSTIPTDSGDAPTCGGVTTLPKDDGGTWTCSFQDEFRGDTLDRTKWLPQTTWGSNFSSNQQDCFVDDPDNVSVSGGSLNLTTRLEPRRFTCMASASTTWRTQITSGSVSTYGGRFSQQHGRFEVRARVTGARVAGLHEAFWLWPDDDSKYGTWPKSGEIDIAEIFHQYPDRAIPFIHYNNEDNDENATNNHCMIDDVSKFHTYVAEWTSESIKIIYDGVLCLENRWSPASPQTGRQPFDQPFIIALTQALGIGTNNYSPLWTPLPATTQVDYVRVYK